MDFIISCQGEQLNKFQSIRIDYFDKEHYWSDFQDLVRRPVAGILEISDKALNQLYSQTAGNPFFTTIICSGLFPLMVERRDTHVTEAEIKESMDVFLKESGPQVFSHFWEDGIKEKADKEEEISIGRRRMLIIIGRLLQKNIQLKKENIVDASVKHRLTDRFANYTLIDFKERKILIENNKVFDFRIKIFKKWILQNGINSIITSFSDSDKIKERQFLEDEAAIKSDELVQLVKHWPTYNGQEITTGKSISENLKEFIASNSYITDKNIKVYIGVITGFLKGKEFIENECKGLGVDVNIVITEPLSDKCFYDNNRIFTNRTELITCKDLCYEKGALLEKNNPFGYGDCQALVVFPNTCPNDCLPILWKSGKEWSPLFPRKL